MVMKLAEVLLVPRDAEDSTEDSHLKRLTFHSPVSEDPVQGQSMHLWQALPKLHLKGHAVQARQCRYCMQKLSPLNHHV